MYSTQGFNTEITRVKEGEFKKNGAQIISFANINLLLSTEDYKHKIIINNNLIVILHAFHEMIKRTLHDFYL